MASGFFGQKMGNWNFHDQSINRDTLPDSLSPGQQLNDDEYSVKKCSKKKPNKYKSNTFVNLYLLSIL